MGVSVELCLPWGEFPLAEPLGDDAGREATVEPIVPIADTSTVDVWVHDVTGEPSEAVDAPDARVIERRDGSVLYRLSVADDQEGFLGAVRNAGGAVTSARSNAGQWFCTVRFRNHARVSEFKTLCDRDDVTVSLQSIDHEIEDSTPDGPLTPAQRETLELAVERGYFSIPRDATLSELADELGVSDQATSERIRRGVQALLVRRLDAAETVEH
jgi:predicted DNA binding protein